MARLPHLLIAMLLVAAALAGCATPAPDDQAFDEGGDDAGTGDGDSSSDGDTGPSGGADAEPETWDGFDFERVIEPRSGGSGQLKTFDYRHTESDNDETTIIDVHVEVLPVGTFPVRTAKMTFGGEEPEPVSHEVELRPVRHTTTIVQDDDDPEKEGEQSTVTFYRAVNGVDEERGFNGYFVMAHVETAEGEGRVEYYLTPEMDAEDEDADFFYSIYTEGDISGDWWGHIYLLGVYGQGTWYSEGSAYEEEEFSFPGMSSSTRRAQFEIGDYTFDGWRVSVTTESGDSTAILAHEVAPGLPVPISYHIESKGSNPSLLRYELTNVQLG